MSINSIANQYFQISQSQGTKGDGGSFQVNYQDDVLTFAEADGDKYTINASNLSDADIEMLASVLGVEVADGTEKSDTDSRLEELRESADGKQSEIERVSDEIGEIYDETIEEQEKITKNEYQRILDLVNNSVAQFLEARKSGKQVDINDLNSTIMQGVENSTYEQDLADVFSNLEGANTKMQEMSTLLMEYGNIKEEAKVLDEAKIQELQSEAGAAISDDELALIESTSLSFLCSNFFEIGTEKLNGHKEQYTLVSNFKELDDGIIQMYTEYASSVSATVQSLINQEEGINKANEPKNDKKANENKANIFAVDENEEDEEEKEAKAA